MTDPPSKQAPIVCIVDPNLKDFVGHYYEYDAAVARGARASGCTPVILGNRQMEPSVAGATQAIAAFSEDIWGTRRPATRLGRLLERLRANLRFGHELAQHMVRLPENTVVFAHTFADRQLLGLALLPLRLYRRRSLQYVYLLRYQPAFYMSHEAGVAFRLLEWLAKRRQVRLATDSERLGLQLEQLTSLPIEVLPIPHVPAEAASAPPTSQDTARLPCCVSLGNARDEKGIVEIFDAIRLLHAQGLGERYRFILQCNDAMPDIAAAIDAFRAEALPNCELLTERLEPDAYQRLLHAADIVLLPYWRSIYAARTSGVFMEALSAGKPVIATHGTWMSDQLVRHGAGMLCDDHDPASLAHAIRTALAELPALAAKAGAARAAWLAIHNPLALARALLAPEPPRPPAWPPRRIALLYPWDDFLQTQGGASRRCNLLVDHLAPHVDAIHVLQSGMAPPDLRPNCQIQSFGRVPLTALTEQLLLRLGLLVHSLLRLLVLLGWRRQGARHDWILWQYLRLCFVPRYRKRIAAAVRRADAVLLEYPFWMRVVAPIARREGKRVILTSHDIIADQLAGFPTLRRIAWRLERAALARADRLVAVSAADRASLHAAGLRAELSFNPADRRMFAIDHPTTTAQLGELALPPGPICLFVGSLHDPNVVAASRIRGIARQMHHRTDVGFVIVGACAAPERDGNYLALGRIDDAMLLALYARAAIVLVPLPSGTGTSLKTVEAMATGKPVLGTTAAFRGLQVTPGVDVMVEDDIDRYPDRIAALLADDDERRRIGVRARRFAAQYDERNVFRVYLDLLELRTDTPLVVMPNGAQRVRAS